MWIHGWSKVTDTIMMAHMRVNNQPTYGGGGQTQHLDNLGPSSAPISMLPSVTTSGGGAHGGSSGSIGGVLTSSNFAGVLTAARNASALGGSGTLANPQGGVKRSLQGQGIDALIAAGEFSQSSLPLSQTPPSVLKDAV